MHGTRMGHLTSVSGCKLSLGRVRADDGGKRSVRFPAPAANSANTMSTCRLAFAAVVALLLTSVASQGPECKSGSHPSVMAVAQSCLKGQLFCKDVQVDIVEFDMDSPSSTMKVLHPAVIPNFPHKQAFLSTVLSASDASNAYFFFPSPSPLLLTVPLSGMHAPPPPLLHRLTSALCCRLRSQIRPSIYRECDRASVPIFPQPARHHHRGRRQRSLSFYWHGHAPSHALPHRRFNQQRHRHHRWPHHIPAVRANPRPRPCSSRGGRLVRRRAGCPSKDLGAG